jgi:putative NADH-flavin reductase
MQLVDRYAIGRQVGQQVADELVHRQQRMRAIGRSLVRQLRLPSVIQAAAVTDRKHELHLVAGFDL